MIDESSSKKDDVTTDTADESEVDEEQERGAAEVDETVEQSAETSHDTDDSASLRDSVRRTERGATS